MIYALILKDDAGFVVWYRFLTKFQNKREEDFLQGKLVAVLSEESGDVALLDKKISAWKEEAGVKNIYGVCGLDGAALEPTKEEYLVMLQKQIRVLSDALEDAQRKKDEWRSRTEELISIADRMRLSMQEMDILHRNEILGVMDTMQIANKIIADAESAGCGCVQEARAKFRDGIIWQ